jgi:hypothetical protein
MDKAIVIHRPRRQALTAQPEASAHAQNARTDAAPSPIPMMATVPPARGDIRPAAGLAKEAIALSKASGPGLPVVPTSRPEVLERMRSWVGKFKEAEAAGVDLRKATFVNKRSAAMASLFSLGAAIALTIGTGGVASPLIIVAAVRSGMLIGDCICSYFHWKGPPETVAKWLPMGGSFVGNAFHHLFTAMGAKPETAAKYAGRGGALVATGMAAAMLGLGFPHQSLDLGILMCRYISGIGGVAASEAQWHATDKYDPVAKGLAVAGAEFFLALRSQGKELGLESEAFKSYCDELRQALGAESPSPELDKKFTRLFATLGKKHDQLAMADFIGFERVNYLQRVTKSLVGTHSTLGIGVTVLSHAQILG